MAEPSTISILVANAQAEEIKTTTIGMRSIFSGCRVEAVYAPEEVLEWVSRHAWDVILLDEQLLQPDWLAILPDVKELAPKAIILTQTDQNDIGIAMQAIRAGAAHCFYKKSSTFLTDLPAITKALLEKRETPAQLEQAKDHFVPLAEHMTEVVYELDPEGRFVNVSPGVMSLLGYTAEELIGSHFSKIVPAEELHLAQYHLNERRTGDRATRNTELHLITKRGGDKQPELIEIELTAMGLYDQQRKVLGTVGVIRDVRRRKQALRQREEQLRAELQRREEELRHEFKQHEEQLGKEYHEWESKLERELKRREEQLRQEFLDREQLLRREQLRREPHREVINSTEQPHLSGTILLVEAQDTVRGLTREVLQRHGYTVLEAPDASEALAICKTQNGPIHLLVTDVAKPGTIGLELASRLTLMRPEMKVLYLSGYLNDTKTHLNLLTRGIGFLQKPFTPDTLIHKIAEMVNIASASSGSPRLSIIP
ncbi:MAG: response regulator [Nitrospiraceae bacterium]